jgi:transcription antitermination factor NusG|tara:strand:- start:302 stop:511 length:210 start_codon:yes stop_codon:yes gene_type:complete
MKSTTITLKVGDSIELGRFKNVTAKIKDIKKDAHGQPVIVTSKGDKKVLTFRLKKLEPKAKDFLRRANV